MWAIFSLSVIIRGSTSTLSRVKVRFKKPVELAGVLLCGAIIGWLMVCFSLFSLHTPPLATQFLGGGFNSGTTCF